MFATVVLGVVLPTVVRMGSRSLPDPVYFTWPLKVTSPAQSACAGNVPVMLLRALVPNVAVAAEVKSTASGVPLMAMLGVGVEELEGRAEAVVGLVRAIGGKVELEVVRSEARCGGGTMPKGVIPSVALRVTLRGVGADEVARRLRLGRVAVLGRVAGGAVLVDLRTVLPGQDGALGEVLGRLG
jgi:L-seryl-tRNA(Ser) seleniumtransferase